MDRDPSTPTMPLFPSGYRVWTTANTIPAGRHHHRSPPRGQRPRGNSTTRRLFDAARTVLKTPRSSRNPTHVGDSRLIICGPASVHIPTPAPALAPAPAPIPAPTGVRTPPPAPLTFAQLGGVVSFGSDEEESSPETTPAFDHIVFGEVSVHRPHIVTREPREPGNHNDYFAHLEHRGEICEASPIFTEDDFSHREQEPEICEASPVTIASGRPTSIYEPSGPTEVQDASTVSYTAAGRPVSVVTRALTSSQEELYRRATRAILRRSVTEVQHTIPRRPVPTNHHTIPRRPVPTPQHTIPRRPVPEAPAPPIPARSAARGTLHEPEMRLKRRSTAPNDLPPRPSAPTPSASTLRVPPVRPARPLMFGESGGPRREVALDPSKRTSIDSDIEEMEAIAANTFF